MTNIITAALVVMLVIIDQVTKYLVVTFLKPINAVTVIDGILQFRYVENTGAAFGIFNDKTDLLSIFTGIIILAGFIYLFFGKKKKSKLNIAAWVLILSGGLGNLIDRVIRHFVVDFIEVTFTDYAVFNFADCLVTVGAALLILYVVLDTIREHKEMKKTDDNTSGSKSESSGEEN